MYEVEEKKPRLPPKPPPRTCDEWLTSTSGAGQLVSTDGTLFIPSKDNGVIQWPNHPPFLDYLVPAPPLPGEEYRVSKNLKKHENPGDTILGSLEEIREDLRRHAPWDTRLLDGVERKLEKLELETNVSADNFVDDEQRSSRESVFGGLANLEELAFMTELSEELLSMRNLSSSMAGNKSGGAAMSRMQANTVGVASEEKSSGDPELSGESTKPDADSYLKMVQDMIKRKSADRRNTLSSGYTRSGTVLVALPGKLDPLAILNLVNNHADIPSYLVQSWKRMFFCSESASILQNGFWWMWLDYFQPKKWVQSLLYNQIADDFASLFIKMDDRHKDEVFMRYPVYLAQALYSAFCHAFPSSNQEINTPKCLDYICNTISEWIVGVKSRPEQWKQWPRHFLNPHFLSLQPGKDSAGSKMHRRSFIDKNMQVASLSQQLSQSLTSSLTSEGATARLLGARPRPRKAGKRISAEPDSPNSSETLSLSKIEIGPIFECVRFSIYGRSPLLQHYLYRHNLTDFKIPAGLSMSRTQVREFPPAGVTYKQLLRGHEKKSQRQYDEYKNQMAQSGSDILQARSKHKANFRKTEMQNQRLLKKRHEVARIAERLAASKDEGIIGIQTNELELD